MSEPQPGGTRVVVVGGGLAGLVAARKVARARPDLMVEVLEGSACLGGKLAQADVGGFTVDVGAESMLARRPEGVELVADLGLGADLVHPATTAARVWTRGSLYPLPRGTSLGIPADPESARGILTDEQVARLAQDRPWPGEVVEEDVSVGEYIGARLGRAVVDRLVEPLLGGVYAGHADRLSLQATLPPIWAKARAGEPLLGNPSAPAASTQPVAATPVFAGVRGGMGRLPDALAADLLRLGVRIRTGATVRELAPSPRGWSLVLGSAADPERIEAAAVVLAVPPAPAARLLRSSATRAAGLLGDLETASVAVITLAVERKGVQAWPGSGFLVPPVEGRVIKASTFSAAKWAWVGDLSSDVVHLRASVGRAGQVADLQRSDEELVAVAVGEIGEALGAPLPRVVDSHVQRWGGGLPQYAVGHVDAVATIRADVSSWPGLAVAGAAYDGVGIPAVIASGHRAAADIIGGLAASTPAP